MTQPEVSAATVVGPYSASVRAGDFVFCSGQLPIDPGTGELAGRTIQQQTDQAIENISTVLRASGCALADVVKTTVYLRSLDDFSDMNESYARYFGESRPARSTIGGVDLPRNARVEIEAIAIRPSLLRSQLRPEEEVHQA